MILRDVVISEIRRISEKLGRPPRRHEISEHSTLITRHDIEKAFGLYSAALEACGFAAFQKRDSAKEQIKQFFERSPEDLIKPQDYKPKDAETFPRVVFIGDLHFPWVSVPHLMQAYQFIETFKPEIVVQVGDIFDFYSFSKFPRSHLVIRPDEEVRLARKMAEEFWESVRRSAPNARLIQILGNHSIRPHKRIIEAAPELEAIVDFNWLFKFEGVETKMDVRTPLQIGSVSVIHGFTNPGQHRAKLLTHVVHGHTHRGGVFHTKNPVTGRHLWELDCGYLGDPSQKCFNYTTVKELNWTRGIGVLTEFGPHFIPFE